MTELAPLLPFQLACPQLLFPFSVEDLTPHHELEIVEETDESIRLRGDTVMGMGEGLGDRVCEEIVLRKSDYAASEIELLDIKWILTKLEFGVELDACTFDLPIPENYEVERTTAIETRSPGFCYS